MAGRLHKNRKRDPEKGHVVPENHPNPPPLELELPRLPHAFSQHLENFSGVAKQRPTRSLASFHNLCLRALDVANFPPVLWSLSNSSDSILRNKKLARKNQKTRNTSENMSSFTDRQHNCLANPCAWNVFRLLQFFVSARSIHLPLHKPKLSQSWRIALPPRPNQDLVPDTLWPSPSDRTSPARSQPTIFVHISNLNGGANPREVVVTTKIWPCPSQKHQGPKRHISKLRNSFWKPGAPAGSGRQHQPELPTLG